MRLREGVTGSVNETMERVQADVLREDGLLMRACEHGVRHPVGHLHDTYLNSKDRAYHERKGERWTECCENFCCSEWAQKR